MRGPEAARAAVAAWLTEAMPGKLAELEGRLDLDSGTLGVPVTIAPYDTGPLGIDQLPALIVDQASLSRIQSDSGNDAGGEDFVTRYQVRILTWIRADGYQLTDQLGMRWALAVLEVLLSRARLDDQGSRTDPRTIVQDYSGVLSDATAGGQLCGCSTTVTVLLDETMDGPPLLGAADTFTLGLGLLTRDTGNLPDPLSYG